MNYIINAFLADYKMLLDCTLNTLKLLFLGYFIGVPLGLVTGIACGYSRRARYWLDPIIKFLRPIPTSTWIPIIMVVASSLFGGAVFIIALGSWFAVTVASLTGISNVGKAYFEAARTLGANDRQLVFRVAIPHALQDVSTELSSGEFVPLVDPSGCGKSTILRLVAGLISPTLGRITVNGPQVDGPSPDRGLVFQNPTLFPWLTVEKIFHSAGRAAGCAGCVHADEYARRDPEHLDAEKAACADDVDEVLELAWTPLL